jgi:hypothetical protein
MGTVTEDKPAKLTDDDLVQTLKDAETEQGVLEFKIRNLMLQADQLEAKVKALAAERNKRIIEAMQPKQAVDGQEPEKIVTAHVARRFAVSRGWIWKLLNGYHP